MVRLCLYCSKNFHPARECSLKNPLVLLSEVMGMAKQSLGHSLIEGGHPQMLFIIISLNAKIGISFLNELNHLYVPFDVEL